VLHSTLLESRVRDKHSTLLGPDVSCEENKVWPIKHQGPYSQQFAFFVTYK
jgi:hypothetical protein